MLRTSLRLLETWRARYHRIRHPRTCALSRHIDIQSRKLRAKAAAAAAAANAGPESSKNAVVAPSTPGAQGSAPHHATSKYRYNRWFVSERGEFIHQEAIVEDPEVIMQRKLTLPAATSEQAWRKPHSPFFEPMLPFVRVVDYPKDPDTKFMKPVNVPRWKDHMTRNKPVVPRTWY